MVRKLGLWLLWAGLISYVLFLAPPDHPDTIALIKQLATAQVAGINPLIVALFNLLGIFPLIYSCLLLIDGRMQHVRAFPFVLASFAVGAFALIPYLALRNPHPTFTGERSWLLKVLDSRWLGALVVGGTIGLLVYGVTQGDWSDFARQWQTSRFIHVMSLDFCILCLLLPLALQDDMARRGLSDDRSFWAVSLVPLLGVAFYLTLRPPLLSTQTLPSQPPVLS